MKNHIIITAISIFVVIIIGMFVFAFLKEQELKNTSNEQVTNDQNVIDPYANITRIDAKHFFKEGTHTLVGEITMPTACDLLNWDARVAESMPEQVTAVFTVVNNADSCAQVLTQQRFNVDFVASENATISATFDGRAVELNLVPAADGETPEDYELYIKG